MLTGAWTGYVAALAILAVYGAHRLYLTWLCWRVESDDRIDQNDHRQNDHPDRSESRAWPVVTVQLPLFNERYVAARLIGAVAALDWPRDRLEIQVLDDSTDDTTAICRSEVEALRRRGYDAHLLHRTDRAGFKAGALAAGLARARGDILLVLDADFVPPPGLVRDVAEPFGDPRVGMVQVRWEHLNRDYSSLTQVQSLLLDGHFVVEQQVRARTGRFFNFNGTAGAWRRTAIEDAGGWHSDTLTEDLDLSYRALLAGWQFRYRVGQVAPAELPVDMNGFKSQQFRWAKGSVQVARKLLPRVLRAPLPAKVKLEAFFHLTQNLPYLITLALVLLAVPALALRDSSAQELWWLHVPTLVGTTGTLAAYCLTSQRALGRSGWRVLARIPALIAVTVGISLSQSRAVVEGALGRVSGFVRTPKLGVVGRRRPRQPRYRGLRGLIPAFELILAAYFAAALAWTVAAQRWAVAPAVAVFALGFGYVGLWSWLRR